MDKVAGCSGIAQHSKEQDEEKMACVRVEYDDDDSNDENDDAEDDDDEDRFLEFTQPTMVGECKMQVCYKTGIPSLLRFVDGVGDNESKCIRKVADYGRRSNYETEEKNEQAQGWFSEVTWHLKGLWYYEQPRHR